MVRGRHPVHPLIIKALLSSNKCVATHRLPPQHRGHARTSGHAPSSQLRGGGKNHSPRCNWTSFTSRVFDLRCRASWQAAVTTLSMKSSAICNSICGRTRTRTSLISPEQLKLCGKYENEPSEARISKAFATIAVLKPFSTLGRGNRHGWLKAAANMRIQKRKRNQPSLPWTKGHRSVKNSQISSFCSPRRGLVPTSSTSSSNCSLGSTSRTRSCNFFLVKT